MPKSVLFAIANESKLLYIFFLVCTFCNITGLPFLKPIFHMNDYSLIPFIPVFGIYDARIKICNECVKQKCVLRYSDM